MNNQEPKVSIVTLNYNGKHLLDKHYTSLLNQSYRNFDLTMVDNGSTDDSVKFVKENFPKVKIVKISKNIGPVKGYMKGASSISKSSKYIVICGNDTWFDRDWLKEQVATIEQDQQFTICGGRQMNYKGNKEINFGVGIDFLGYPVLDKSFFYIDGAAIMVKRDVFMDLGGYDERFWVYDEETDFAWRTWLAGYKLIKSPKAIFYHLGGATLDAQLKNIDEQKYKTSYKKRYLTEKNTLCMLLKNYSSLSLLVILPLFFILNFLEGIVFLFLGKPMLLVSHLRAWMWNVKNIKYTWKLRNKIQSTRKISDLEIMRHMYRGLAKTHYLKKIGTFEIS